MEKRGGSRAGKETDMERGGGGIETKQTWREKDRQTDRDRDEDKQ